MDQTLLPIRDPLQITTIKSKSSAGTLIQNSAGDSVLLLGAGPSQGTTAYGQINGTSLALSAGITCTTLTASGALGAFQYGAQPTGGEDVAVWVNKTSSTSVARSFQSYITHSGGGGSTAYDAVASTSATSGHNVCYQGVSKATGAATPSYLSFAYGSGDSASSGTIADAYGYYWGGWTGAGTITRKWAFFNAATDKSFFGGDLYGASKIGIGVSSTATLGWSMTINHPTAPVLAWQRNEVDIGYLCNASTVFSGKPNTDLAIAQAGAGAVWIGSNGVGMLKVDDTGVTAAAGITCTTLTMSGTSASTTAGILQVESGQDHHYAYTNGIGGWVDKCLFSQYASVTQSGIVTSQSLASATAKGTRTLPANFFKQGKVLKFRLCGRYTTDVAAGNATIDILIGGTTFRSTGSFAMDNSSTNQPWEIEGEITCYTTGATGTVEGVAWWAHGITGATGNFNIESMAGTGTVTIDTTAANTFDVQWTATDAGTAITCSCFRLWEIC